MAEFDLNDIAKSLENVANSSNKVIDATKKLDSVITKFAATLKGDFNLLDPKEITKLNKALDEANTLQDAKIKNDKLAKEELLKLQKVEKEQLKIQQEQEKLTREKIKTEKEELKLLDQKGKKQKESNKDTDEAIKASIRLQESRRKQRQALKAEILLEEKQIKTLSELKKQTSALKIVRDSLDFEKDAKRIEELNKQIDDNNKIIGENVDEQTKQKLSVGAYRREVGEAIKDNIDLGEANNTLTSILSRVKKVQESYNDSLENSKEQAKEAGKSFNKLGSRVKGFSKALAASGLGALVLALGAVTSSFQDTETGAKSFQKVTSNIINGFKFIGAAIVDFAIPSIKNLIVEFKKFGLETKKVFQFGDDVKDTNDKIKALNKSQSDYNKQIDEFKSRDFTKEIKEVSKATNDLIDSQFALRKSQRILNEENAKRSKTEEELLAISEDDTRSFNERSEARIKLQKILQGENNSIETRLKLAKLERDTILEQVELSKLTNANGEASLTLLDELSQAEVAYIESLKDSNIQRVEQNQKLRKELFDEVEQTVDFLIDGNDQIKTNNEELINSEKENLNTRKSLLKETQDLITRANLKVQEEIARTVEGLSGSDIGKAFDEAINPEDLNNRLKSLGLAEIPIKRLLELFGEIQTQTRDFAKSSEVITQAEADMGRLRKEILSQEEFLNNETIDNEEDLNEALEKLRKDRFENQKSVLEQKLKESKQNSLEELSIQKELNDLLISEEERLANKRIEVNKKEKQERDKILEDQKKKSEETSKFITELGEELTQESLNNSIARSEAREEEINKDINRSQQQQDRFKELLATGNSQQQAFAQEALLREQQNERRKTAELKKEKREQAFLQASVSAVDVLAGFSGQPNAAAKTITELAKVLSSVPGLVGSIKGFYKGTTTTLGNEMSATKSGKDGHLIWADSQEAILNPKQTSDLGIGKGRTTNDVVNIVKSFDHGIHKVTQKEITSSYIINNNLNEMAQQSLLSEIQGLRKDVKDSKSIIYPPTGDFIEGVIEYKQKQGNTTHKYIRNINK